MIWHVIIREIAGRHMGRPLRKNIMALLNVINLKKHFPVRSGLLLKQTATVHAVDDVSFDVQPNETLGLVGESGCGKSTLGRTLIRLYRATDGKILFQGKNISELNPKELMAFRRNVQMVFQDPYSSLNPRKNIASILEQPLIVHKMGNKKERLKKVSALLERVGLGTWALNRYPHEFSGGQRQRIAIARALTLDPKLVIADESVSALDVSVQSQILNLMKDLQKDLGITYIFIAHDLAVVKHMADRIAVMYLGKIVEMGHRDEIFARPKHPYTQALMAAIPEPGKKKNKQRQILQGDVPSPVNPPQGCHFHPRCPFATGDCRSVRPALQNWGSDAEPYLVACHEVKGREIYPDLAMMGI